MSAVVLPLADQPKDKVPPYWQKELTPGRLGQFVIREEGDLTLKFVQIRLDAAEAEIVPVPSASELGIRTRSVAELARRYSVETKRPVLAAVNGGFFDVATGLPIGFLMRNSRMEFFNMPQGYQRSMVGFCSPGIPGQGSRVWISTPQKMPKVYLDTVAAGFGHPVRSSILAVHHINVPGGQHAFSLFTPAYRAPLRPPRDALYLIAQSEAVQPGVYRVTKARDRGGIRVPADGLVIALHGSSRKYAQLLRPGTLVRPRWSLPAEWENRQVAHAILAGPRLLSHGAIQVTAREERLDSLKSRDRMALGVKPNGDTILLWAHKNTRGNLPFERVAEILARFGAVEAIGLDGGNSRAILAEIRQGYARDYYFEGGRPVANALVLSVKS